MFKIKAKESKNDELIDELLEDPNYKVYPNGTIFTCVTENGQGISEDWRQVGYVKADGYVRFRYKGEFLFVQRVIYRAFNGPLDKFQTINHIDRDRSNNHPKNLEMVSQGENNKKKRKKYKKAFLFINKNNIIEKVLNKIRN